jgi:hypothetical protein
METTEALSRSWRAYTDELRGAAACEDMVRVHDLLSKLPAVLGSIRTELLEQDAGRLAALEADALNQLEWVRRLVMISRHQVQSQLNGVRAASAYLRQT